MLTRNTYTVFAAVIGRNWDGVSSQFVLDLMHYFAQDNPRFNKELFVAAIERAVPMESSTRANVRKHLLS